jgi:hypothetical protein
MNIQINDPCHEDWQAMTPNRQGAFCQVCQKDVVDFSKKSIPQIKSFFKERSEEKICGRFEKKQLVYLSFDDFFASFRYWALSRKVAVVFFFTLGFMAFTATAQTGTTKGNAIPQAQTHTLGEPVVQQEKPITPPEHYLQGDVAYIPKDTSKKNNQPVMGKIKCTNPPPPKQKTKKQVNQPVMGLMTLPSPKEGKKQN